MRKISKWVFVVAALTAAPVVTILAQGTPPSGPTPIARAEGETRVPGKCLFKEDLDVIEAHRVRTRSTLNNDAPAPFDPDYLVGRWKYEYEASESVLGPGGQVSAIEAVQNVEGCLYEGTTQAKGPAGAFTIKSTIVYDPSAHYMVVLERDSRGFDLLKTGHVGGDSGGFYTHHWEAAPFTFKGKRVRLKGTTFMASPANYRVRDQISEGDDPFVNLGTVWVQRQAASGGK
jgi:hypothetical protein